MRQEKLVCVNCPKGCNITVQIEGDEVKDVQGYSCKEGLNYARQEVIRPMRILTSTVRIEGALNRVAPVITDGEIPLDMWHEAMDEIKTIKVSAKEGRGMDNLIENLSAKTSALVGQSGVGKSTLLNFIAPDLNLKTSAISDKYDRGTHTTTQGEYFKIKALTSKGKEHSINIIDTPGVRHFAIYGIEPEDTVLYFPEMEKVISL